MPGFFGGSWACRGVPGEASSAWGFMVFGRSLGDVGGASGAPGEALGGPGGDPRQAPRFTGGALGLRAGASGARGEVVGPVEGAWDVREMLQSFPYAPGVAEDVPRALGETLGVFA